MCPSVCLCTCKSVHMQTNPRLYVVFMYVCNHVSKWVGGCVRACERACVCMCAFVHKCASAYTRFFMGAQACVRLHACLLICTFAYMHVRASVHVFTCVRVRACRCTFCLSAFVYGFVFVHVYARSYACARPFYF